MKYSKLIEKTNICIDIMKSRRIWNIFKFGSNKERIKFLFYIFFFITAWILLFISEIKKWHPLLSLFFLIIFILSVLLVITEEKSFFFKHNKKGMNRDEEFLSYFIDNLEKNKITCKDCKDILDYLDAKNERKNSTDFHELQIYLNLFLLPLVISYLSQEKFLQKSLIYCALGTLVIPGVILLFLFMVNIKNITIASVIYYLKLTVITSENRR